MNVLAVKLATGFSEIKLFAKDHISLPQKYKFEMMWAVRLYKILDFMHAKIIVK